MKSFLSTAIFLAATSSLSAQNSHILPINSSSSFERKINGAYSVLKIKK